MQWFSRLPNCYLLKLALYKSLITQVQVEKMVINTVYTPVDMPSPTFLSACNSGLFTGEFYGIIVARNLRKYGYVNFDACSTFS